MNASKEEQFEYSCRKETRFTLRRAEAGDLWVFAEKGHLDDEEGKIGEIGER